MAKGIDLELLREVFKDDAVHLSLAVVTRVQWADDASAVYVTCNLLPENREIMAQLGFDSVGENAGAGDLPELRDLVLVCFAQRENEHAFVISRFSSAEEPLPLQMKDGHYVVKSKPGKKAIVASDTHIEIGKGIPTAPPTEPLVLGNVLTTYLEALEGRLTALIDALTNNPIVISTAPGTPAGINPALATVIAAIKTGADADKSTYLTTAGTNILSQIAVTERGN